MARPKPWLKLWTEWEHDPKLISQTLAERGAWSLLLSLAQECAAGGYIVKGNGSPMSVKDMARCLHITSVPDIHSFTSMLKKMENQGSLSWEEGCLFINNFTERQALKPSDTKEAARDRQRLRRERKAVTEKKSGDAPPLPPPKTPPPVYTEGEGESHATKGVTRHGKSVTLEPALAEIVKLHEKNFSIITPFLVEKFKLFVENYHGPVEWIALAFAEAMKYKNRRWEYVEAILYSWQEKGGPHADRREPGGERGRPGADKPGPKKGDGFAGFTAIESGPDEPDDDDD